jgi:hypothetical protein
VQLVMRKLAPLTLALSGRGAVLTGIADAVHVVPQLPRAHCPDVL